MTVPIQSKATMLVMDRSVGLHSTSELLAPEPSKGIITHPGNGITATESSLPENPVCAHLPPLMDDDKLVMHMLYDAGLLQSQLVMASKEQKVSALAAMSFAFCPPFREVQFTRRVIETVRTSLRFRNLLDQRYYRFYVGQNDIMMGGELVAMPPFAKALQSPGFVVAGSTGAGKTALLHRIRVILGDGNKLVSLPPGCHIRQVRFLPTIVLHWPKCGTLQGFMEDLKNELIAQLGSSETNARGFNFEGKRGINKAIATCVYLNLGLFVLDGINQESISARGFTDIISFVSKLKTYSGIPTLISCTSPVLQAFMRFGSEGASLANASVHHLDPIPLGSLWDNLCSFLWKLGLHGIEEIPAYLPTLVWEVSLGNLRIASQAFQALHYTLAEKPSLIKSGTVDESRVRQIFAGELRHYAEPLKIVSHYLDSSRQDPSFQLKGADAYFNDYLPFNAFTATPQGDFEKKKRRVTIPAPS